MGGLLPSWPSAHLPGDWLVVVDVDLAESLPTEGQSRPVLPFTPLPPSRGDVDLTSSAVATSADWQRGRGDEDVSEGAGDVG